MPSPAPALADSEPLVSSSASGASLLIALQVGSRALTFLVNQVLLRYLSPELLGISTQLEVYSISVLFFARESLRVAIQRQDDVPDKQTEGVVKRGAQIPKGHVDGSTAAGRTQAIVNLSHLSIILGAGFALLLATVYTITLNSNDPSILATPYFKTSLKLYGFAAFWELLSEPCFVVVQQKSRFRIRAAAESVATVSRCLVTCGVAIYAAKKGIDSGVLPFAAGQLIYAVGILAVYLWQVMGIASNGNFTLLPKKIFSGLGGSFFAQSIFKHILTQGDTLLISSLASQRAQGIYALANNYGGLVARLLLQPIEESSRNYFGKLLSSANGQPSKELVLKAKTNLNFLLRAYVLLSVVVLAIGPTIAPLLLNIVAGSRWTASGAGHVLSTYCYYIPLLAINGLTEAFVSSVATEAEVNRQSMWMLAFSAGFGGAAYIFLRVLDLGAEGLVWANTLNMILRVIWSTSFISAYLKRNGTQLDMRSLIPQLISIGAGVGTNAVLTQMEKQFTGGIMDIIKSGAVAGIFAIVLAASERNYLIECYNSIRGKSTI